MDTIIKRENCLEDSKLAKQGVSVGCAGLNIIRITCKKYNLRLSVTLYYEHYNSKGHVTVFKILFMGRMSVIYLFKS